MYLPSGLFPISLFPGSGCRVFGSIVNAAADGKRLRAIDALGNFGQTTRKPPGYAA
jgi:hypothetical protein